MILPYRLAFGLLLAFVYLVAAWPTSFIQAGDKPNFIMIFCDNLGYGDIGCFGSSKHRTPHIDRLAHEGMKFTDFYASSGVCTPSRASLMTGCYPRRVGLHLTEPDGAVLRPVSPNGLSPDEITMAEVLKEAGYRTACIGKWHLGDQPKFLPTRQGFEYFFGIPYSDDMTPREGQPWPPLPLMRNETVIEAPVDRNLLTRRCTEEAIRFITENKDVPFFLYLPHPMPGSTRAPFASPEFQGRSTNGAWGDAIEEIDWSTGEIARTLNELGLDERTLVVWTSDNGAPRHQPPSGSNAPLSGWGYTTDEGGMRIPCVMRWSGTIPAASVCSEISSTMDLLPTFAAIGGGILPGDRILDGKDIRPLLLGTEGATSPHEAFYYYYLDQLQAVRSGRWKLFLPLENRRTNLRADRAATPTEARLYDLRSDISESHNVAQQYPGVVQRLLALAEVAREDLGDGDQSGKNQRLVGNSPNPRPLVKASND